MKPADGREEALFRQALQRPCGPEREGFLDWVEVAVSPDGRLLATVGNYHAGGGGEKD